MVDINQFPSDILTSSLAALRGGRSQNHQSEAMSQQGQELSLQPRIVGYRNGNALGLTPGASTPIEFPVITNASLTSGTSVLVDPANRATRLTGIDRPPFEEVAIEEVVNRPVDIAIFFSSLFEAGSGESSTAIDTLYVQVGPQLRQIYQVTGQSFEPGSNSVTPGFFFDEGHRYSSLFPNGLALTQSLLIPEEGISYRTLIILSSPNSQTNHDVSTNDLFEPYVPLPALEPYTAWLSNAASGVFVPSIMQANGLHRRINYDLNGHRIWAKPPNTGPYNGGTIPQTIALSELFNFTQYPLENLNTGITGVSSPVRFNYEALGYTADTVIRLGGTFTTTFGEAANSPANASSFTVGNTRFDIRGIRAIIL